MRALWSLFRLKGGRGAKLLLAGLGLFMLNGYMPTQLKEEINVNPLPRVQLDTNEGSGLWRVRQQHPLTIFLPENLSNEVLEQVYRCLPDYKKYSIEGNKVCMVNANHDYQQFEIDSKNDDWLHYVLNFNNPPRTFSREQFDQLLPRLQNDECIVLTFLPPHEHYSEWIGPIQPHDRYSVSKVKNLDQLAEEFKKLKTMSPTNKAQYMVVESEDLAKRLNINYHNTGEVYVLRKTSQLVNNESNFIYCGIRCHMQKVQPSVTSSITPDLEFKFNFLREACMPYISQINIPNDFSNFLRVVQKNESGKLLVVHIPQDQKAEFQQRIEKVLFELKKVFKGELSILLTRNRQLLKNELQISPDQFVTLRLIDLKKIQKPLNLFAGYNGLEEMIPKDSKPVYARYTYKGPFRYSELVDFIRNPPQEFYEDKEKLKLVRPVLPKDLYEINGLVLYQKWGCQGCQILNAVLEELENVVREIQSNGPNCQQYIFKYKITNPQRLKNLKVYRYNILNEHFYFRSPLTTPQLFYFENGQQRSLDINKEEDFTDPKEALRKIVQFIAEL